MIAGDTPGAPVHGLVDAEGRLLRADPPLERLHLNAGGVSGGTLAVPPLAAIVRLVRRLGIVIARGVTAADGDHDLDLWVRARIEGDGVALAIAGWSARPAAAPSSAPMPIRARDHDRAIADWRWRTDANLKVTAISAHAAALLHDPIGALIGRPLSRLFVLVEGPAGDMPIIEAMASHDAFSGQIATLPGGGDVRFRLSGTPIFDAAGAFAGLAGVAARDAAVVPEPPASPPVFEGSFGDRLEAALRLPLDRIIAGADDIRAQDAGPLRRDYADYAADIALAGRHLMVLVNDLVELQAVERPDFAIILEDVDLADIARRAAGLLGVRAADSGVRIDRPAADEVVPARGDFTRALQIMVNLVGNAIRYSPRESSVWIRAEQEGPVAALIVADQGKGIAPQDQDRIFDKFERVDPTEAGGTGLGLYIARRLARAMGGDIVVDSAPGQGARFLFTLPAR